METIWRSLLVAAVSPVLTIVALMIWRYTDNTAEALQRLDTDIQAVRQDLSRDIKETNTLLTGNLIELSGNVGFLNANVGTLKANMGSLKAMSHSHPQLQLEGAPSETTGDLFLKSE